MSQGQRIFISYRRSDCQSQANGLNDGLRNRLPDAQVFMDLDSIPPGADFEEHIRKEIDQCDVVLVLIGDEWLDPRPGTNIRRIDEPRDFVRLEVQSALRAKNLRVIPVLVEGAQMPEASQLPDDIARLARLNAFVLSDSHWGRDLQELTRHLTATPQESTVSFADIDADAVRYAVDALPHQFATKDVSNHPAMLATHVDVASRRNYHTIVGRFLMQNRADLGLAAPESPVDDRGSRWTKIVASAPPVPSAPRAPVQPFVPTPPRHAPGGSGQSSAVGKLMIAVPLISFGLLSWVPPLWAAARAKHDPARRRRLFFWAGGLGAVAVLGFAMVGESPTDAEGTATGPMSDLGVALVLACMIAGVVLAVKNRNPSSVPAGAAEELARRDLRQQCRALVSRDPSLALSMRIGRPDLGRDYDDGGLIDINSISAEGLQRYAGMSSVEAVDVLRVRQELGRFSGMSELEAFSTLSPGTIARLREVAVFV